MIVLRKIYDPFKLENDEKSEKQRTKSIELKPNIVGEFTKRRLMDRTRIVQGKVAAKNNVRHCPTRGAQH